MNSKYVLYEASTGGIAPVAAGMTNDGSPEKLKAPGRYDRIDYSSYMKDDFEDDLSPVEFHKLMERTFIDVSNEDFLKEADEFDDMDDEIFEDAKRNNVGIGKMKTFYAKAKEAASVKAPKNGDVTSFRKVKKAIRTLVWLSLNVAILAVPSFSIGFLLAKVVALIVSFHYRNKKEEEILESNINFVKDQLNELDARIEESDSPAEKKRAIATKKIFVKAHRDLSRKAERMRKAEERYSKTFRGQHPGIDSF